MKAMSNGGVEETQRRKGAKTQEEKNESRGRDTKSAYAASGREPRQAITATAAFGFQILRQQ
jgi:hypothetical protein